MQQRTPCAVHPKSVDTVRTLGLKQECIDPYVPTIALRNQDLIRLPTPRAHRDDLVNPQFDDLYDLSLSRVFDLVKQNQEDPPPRLFPTSERVQDQPFCINDWAEFGNMETEIARLTYTLSRYPERALPTVCKSSVETLLYHDSVLDSWPNIVDSLKGEAQEAMKRALSEMIGYVTPRKASVGKGGVLRSPVAYATNRELSKLSVSLWKHALAEIAQHLKEGRYGCVWQFLQIHAFLKDPIGGLSACFECQLEMFMSLLESFRNGILGETVTSEAWQAVAAQLALESSFLAIPKLRKVAYVHFIGHQQLPYVYVTLDKLPRAEFSVPKRVLEIVIEMVTDASDSKTCHVAPITIAYSPPLGPRQKAFKVIIDGNNRVTAIALLRFLATQNLNEIDGNVDLERYCNYHGLGFKWLIDLRDVITELRSSQRFLRTLRAKRNIIAGFKSVVRIPALVVQEPSFHTLWMPKTQTEQTALLQPMHQAIYNDRTLCLAIPAKQQSHGRPLGFKALPLN